MALRNGLAAIADSEEEALSQARSTGDRLAEVGILAAGLAHELNNPIGSILLAAQNAKATPDRADECLETILRNARRCASVVKSVLQVSRRDPGGREAIDVNDLVRRSVDAASDVAAERHATVQLQLQADLAPLQGTPPELEQAIANLVRNAAESGDGIEIRVTTQGNREQVRIDVSDDGKGIASDIRDRVFEPFFTTRQDEGGTGLGLSLVRAIVHAHNGRVELEAGPEKGTRVGVILPRDADGEDECSESLS